MTLLRICIIHSVLMNYRHPHFRFREKNTMSKMLHSFIHSINITYAAAGVKHYPKCWMQVVKKRQLCSQEACMLLR